MNEAGAAHDAAIAREGADAREAGPAADPVAPIATPASIIGTDGQAPLPVPPPTGALPPAPGPAHPGRPEPAHPAPQIPLVHNVTLGNVPVEIGMKSLAGVSHFAISLTPDDLGRVDVRMQLDADGRVKAHLIVDHPETLGYLQRASAHLRDAFEQAGFSAPDGSVAMSLRDPGAESGGSQPQNRDPGENQPSRRGSPGQTASERDAPSADIKPRPRPSSSRGIDRHI